jgi:ABC-type uncharacterized transport system YnjBCD substrate-binding protein
MPGINVASNKKSLAEMMKLMQLQYPDKFDFIPQSFSMPEESQALQEFMNAHPKKTFICKPEDGSEGCGILLAQKFKDIPPLVHEKGYVV